MLLIRRQRPVSQAGDARLRNTNSPTRSWCFRWNWHTNAKREKGLEWLPPRQQLDRMICGYWVSQGIYAAAKFNIADQLKEGPKSVEELAELTATNADALYRLLRALASVGIFAEGQPTQFSLKPMAEQLQSDIPGSQRALALMSGDEQFRAWAEIEHSIRTRETAFEKVFGQPVFDYLGEHPEKAKIYEIDNLVS